MDPQDVDVPSPSPPPVGRAALLVLAVALVTLPVWGGVVGFGEPAYIYASGEVTFDGDGDASYPDLVVLGPARGVDCLGVRESRGCLAERTLVDGNLTTTEAPPTVTGAPYVALPSGIYERVHERRGDRHTFGLVGVSDEQAIRDVAVPWAEASDRVRSGVEAEGEVKLGTALDPDGDDRAVFVEHDGTVFVVTQQRTTTSMFDEYAGPIRIGAVALGLYCFAGWVRRSE